MSFPKCALYTTVHPQAKRFLRTWYESVRAQADGSFDLWFGVDGLSRADVVSCLGEEPRANWVMAGSGDSGASVRLQAMERMVECYDTIIFVDSDDVMIPSRVAAARQALLSHDVVGCALRVIDQEGLETGAAFAPEPDWRPRQLLARYNIFGLSNTAYRADVLRRCLPFSRDCILIDWFLVTRSWLAGADLWFDQVPGMLYRQHELNTARILPPFRTRDIIEATERVLGHYDFILPFVQDGIPCDGAALRAAQQEIAEFDRAMRDSPARLDAYTRSINDLPPRYVWWWAVANPQLRRLWKN